MFLVSHDDALLAEEPHGDHNQTLSYKEAISPLRRTVYPLGMTEK
jgi:hypothetical protein